MVEIKSLSLESLTACLLAAGEKPYRAKQVYQWLHKHLAESFAEMTNLPKHTRDYLNENFLLSQLKIEKMQESKIDGTQKYLFSLADGNFIETVLMKYKHGNSVCISSQVGCRMGCAFCASAIGGLVRQLSAGEMLEQVYAVTRKIKQRISHVVIMGSGEPLDNYDEVLNFIKMISDQNGLNISQRGITVSTCGLTPFIYRLADEGLQINLALSLHAPTDEKRLKLMPITKAYPLNEVLKACQYYFKKTGRRITFEYSLINNLNDSPEEAKELKKLLSAMPCHLNLIPLNKVKEYDFTASNGKNIQDFKKILEKYQINVTIRREMGSDIDGACGQLRSNANAAR
ncbi:MAG: 23S rRNA (adenine(2503)-C(2))-methyltransferase RlmN [Lachnospiraceae bacterium]|nr:23S rRNA (adenine(2503)-C(2))-methyltransferase RlmN [Lachnospiraceae bacterium]